MFPGVRLPWSRQLQGSEVFTGMNSLTGMKWIIVRKHVIEIAIALKDMLPPLIPVSFVIPCVCV